MFTNEAALCSSCHLAGDLGVNFGPSLSGIGSKLGKDALYQAILDPDAGISFGFEGWSLETRSGEELVGVIVSETEEAVQLRLQSGTVEELAKSSLVKREKMSHSLMPSGLADGLTVQELVDLVEFLTRLKAP